MLESNTWTSLVLEPQRFVSNSKLILCQKKTFAISEQKLCIFLVLHNLNTFVKASPGQAGSTSKSTKVIVVVRIPQNKVLLCP